MTVAVTSNQVNLTSVWFIEIRSVVGGNQTSNLKVSCRLFRLLIHYQSQRIAITLFHLSGKFLMGESYSKVMLCILRYI